MRSIVARSSLRGNISQAFSNSNLFKDPLEFGAWSDCIKFFIVKLPHELALRTLHKGVCARYDELSKVCHGNTFALDFLVDQIEQLAQPADAEPEEAAGPAAGRKKARVAELA